MYRRHLAGCVVGVSPTFQPLRDVTSAPVRLALGRGVSPPICSQFSATAPLPEIEFDICTSSRTIRREGANSPGGKMDVWSVPM